jgi:pimeloyl-ACP methyl ester carboxylesterase
MAKLQQSPPPSFRSGIASADLELRGVRARAFQFVDGSRDPARAIVCLAGMGANGRSFARLAPLARDWLILPINTPVETPGASDPLEFTAEVVEEYLDSEGLERPVLLGSSFGGAAAAMVALRRPERLRALVLVSPALSRRQIPLAFPQFIDLLEAPEPIARLMAPLAVNIMGGFALDRESRDEIVRQSRHFQGDELKRRLLAIKTHDLLPALRALETPTLIVHGSRDWLVPWRRGRWTARAIPGSQFHLIRGAGHLPYLSHPHEFNQVLSDFLRLVDH